MATVAALRQRVLDNFYSSRLVERPFVDVLTASYTSGASTIVVSDGGSWARGDIVENPSTEEQMFVLSVATNTLTVRRAYNGTTAAASASTDDVLYKNPRITAIHVDDAMDGVLQELEGYGVHGWATGSLTLVSGQYTYSLSETDIIGVAGVYYARSSDSIPVPLPFHFHDNLHTSVVTSGAGLNVWDWGEKVAGDTLYYTYKQRLDATTKLLARQEELLVNGTAGRLLLGTLAPRTHDPGKFTDRTVQPGQGGRDARAYQVEFLLGVRREQAQLRAEATRMPATMATSRSSRWRP